MLSSMTNDYDIHILATREVQPTNFHTAVF